MRPKFVTFHEKNNNFALRLVCNRADQHDVFHEVMAKTGKSGQDFLVSDKRANLTPDSISMIERLIGVITALDEGTGEKRWRYALEDLCLAAARAVQEHK